jgi:tripartite-type tricarboxylate transporter receptor subunit TctC
MLRRRALPLALAPLLAIRTAAAQSWPSKPLRMIIPWPPGQATDIIGRLIANLLTPALGQPVVPENRPGAGGMIGTDIVAKGPADGHALLSASIGPITFGPLVNRTPYDVEKELAPVAMIGISPYLLTVRNDFPAQTAAEFIKVVKASPGKFTYASSGTGAAAHLITLMFLSRAGLDTLHVPFQGSGPALTAVVSGQVDFAIDTLAATGPLVRQGALRGLGISLASGSELAPDMPPMAQVPETAGFDAGAFGGYMMPAGTPQPIIARLAAETEKAMGTAEVKQRMASIGFQAQPRNTADFTAFLKTHREQFRQVIEANNLRVD